MSKQYDVLVIDDEPVVLDAVARVCTAHGIAVDAAPDSQTGLHRLHTHRYRLILCDIMMPELDGFQLLERVLKETHDTPIVMITGYSTIENAVRSLSSGAIGYLPKPFTEEELVSTVHRGLNFSALLRSGNVDNDGSSRHGTCPDNYYRLGWISWATLEETGAALVGVTDVFLKTVGSVKEIRFFTPHQEIVQGTTCAHIASTTGLLHDVLGPISGKILEINTLLQSDSSVISQDPYGKGWLYRILPSDVGYELKHLTVSGERV